MLTIRKEQMAVFQAYMLRQSLDKLVREFQELRPQHFQTMGAEASHAFVHATVAQGLAWGIRKKKDIWALIDLMLVFGSDFASAPDRPWALPLLNSKNLSGSGKIKLVTAHLHGQLD